ncbi:hypothetical protein AMTRI_Chr03g43400 [Amborella trichopoda]
MEGTLFNYKILLKCIWNIISMKYIMNSVTCSFQLSRCQTDESTSTTVLSNRNSFSPASQNSGKSTARVILRGRLQWKLVSSLCFSRILCVLLINPSLFIFLNLLSFRPTILIKEKIYIEPRL